MSAMAGNSHSTGDLSSSLSDPVEAEFSTSGETRARVAPLSHAQRLIRVSADTAALSRALYGRESVRFMIANTHWRFRWRHVTGPLNGVLLHLRMGSAQCAVGLESPGPFDAVLEVMRPELPPALRVAYLNSVGALAWRELEEQTHAAVEVLDVQPDKSLQLTPDCIGFELAMDPDGVSVQGFLRPAHGEMPHLPRGHTRSAVEIPVRWAAVVGRTSLSIREFRALEEQDTLILENATYTADALGCRLIVGANHHDVGRASVQSGHLHIVEPLSKGIAVMTSATASDPLSRESGFDEIQLNLRFELAQWHAPLSEIATLAPGSVVELRDRIDEQAVTVWADERCIGKGQLVAVGDRLGIRLLTVFGGGPTGEGEVA